ncbi:MULTISPECIES: plasmid partitioning protein RepB C-terminal domain-containing protein [unclassified Hyphomonas]|uniref:plasmid partitioning protein RepB C-terminal domain-containing protein n=1 Tax=unclassified Hyphomonas TaxID=2630699 RepID=UPI000458A6C9|nr:MULTISPECIES: plasmid partitioning protein RepB C-terminal domain-containing protein [unclassified Hyphomonas]KCZ49721.1 hypothetical protein HY17_01100 [Hyphomonas sp. CY54-11-8]
MMPRSSADSVTEIKIEDIYVLNPRDRNRAKFRKIVESISAIGLKRPIKVSLSTGKAKSKPYVLICGQGRLEAFKALGETRIPAIVVSLSEEECYVQSLIENLARRSPTSLETVHEIGVLSDRGFTSSDIAAKTGLSPDYVSGLLKLINDGEQRLYAAVERGDIPISIAVEIARTGSHETQAALNEAYTRKELRGKKLKAAIKLVRDRERWGKAITRAKSGSSRPVTAHAMVRHYKNETERQRSLIRRANLTDARLAVVKSALGALFHDEHFVTLLRAEGLETLPTQIVDFLDDEVGDNAV